MRMATTAFMLGGLALAGIEARAQSSLYEMFEPERIVGDQAMGRIERLFVEYDPEFKAKHAEREARFDELGVELFERTIAGHDTHCSRQIFVEAKWLVGYTAWWPRIDARLDELEGSFEIEDQSFAAEPDYRDGFYGRCAYADFIRLEATVEEYLVMADTGQRPPRNHRPLSEEGEPGVVDDLRRLAISDIVRTGEDYRSRVGGMASILARAVRDEAVVELARTTREGGPLSRAEMAASVDGLLEFVDEWQDPETGYWGAWYRDGRHGLFSTTDLSITYHIIHARKGKVKHWPEIIETTFAIKDDAYPFGWLSDGRWHNHNNYDIARMFRYGWDHMTPAQQKRVADLMQQMVDWTFEHSIEDNYRGFRLNPELSSSVGAELYFGASFLDAVGYFDQEPWFGELRRPEHPARVCANLLVYAATLDQRNTYVIGAISKFDRVCSRFVHRG